MGGEAVAAVQSLGAQLANVNPATRHDEMQHFQS
jgi:hypothetical protein